ncbi:MAG: RNA polymerase sigma factor [Crocinitomicaceae bacterium]|nr:RNA polymerase sigma factor [Crocinitomicaceae bacterium]
MQLDDQAILELVRTNKDRAFNYLVENYSRMVFNTCVQLLRNQEDAEDLTQEVFTTIYLSLDTFEGNSKLSTWMYSISLNKSKEFLRSKTRKKRFGIFTVLEKEDSHTVPAQTINFDHPGVQLENKERANILFDAIDQLAENQKTAYTLHKIEGVSYEEIAAIMDTTVSSVESLMFRAKKRLKQLLNEYYEENEC